MKENLKEKVAGDNGVRSSGRNIWNSTHSDPGKERSGKRLIEAAIVMVVSGSIVVTVDQFENRMVCSGEMFMIPPDCLYHVKVLEKSHVMSCLFHIGNLDVEHKLLNELYGYGQGLEYNFDLLKMNSLTYGCLALLEKYIHYGIVLDELFDLKKKEFFYCLFTLYSTKELAAFLYPIVGDWIPFREFVKQNWMKVDTVGELAALANYSTPGFIKKFKRYFNEAPGRWLLNRKAEVVYQELTTGKLPPKEIVAKYGFSSRQHLERFCKTQFGFTPSQISGTEKPYQFYKLKSQLK